MHKEETEFAAALVSLDDGQQAQCSRVCSVLRVDEIQPAARDASGKVLAATVFPATPNPNPNPTPEPGARRHRVIQLSCARSLSLSLRLSPTPTLHPNQVLAASVQSS